MKRCGGECRSGVVSGGVGGKCRGGVVSGGVCGKCRGISLFNNRL